MGTLTNSGKLIEKIESLEPIEYNAGEGIEIGAIQDYSAMQGPAPDGFHVPLEREWEDLRRILTSTFSMVQDSTTMGTYLKMPKAGRRQYNNSNVDYIDYQGLYWCSNPLNGPYPSSYDLNSAPAIQFYSSKLQNITSYRSYGYSIRCFKDSYVQPDSSWTTLYNGSSVATGAGIFWNSSLGLISVSGDGTTWYTIMDKNLGATTVYNQGDTLTDANCGYFYQWGNNYGFPHSGTVTTSSTKVDASSYGPENYYSSSTFITTSPWNTNATRTDDLWGGNTGIVTIDNAIINTGVLSVNGQTGDVTIASPDMSNYLAKDNTTAFTPTGDYNPSTKKYVDDKSATVMTEAQYGQVSDPIAGKIYFIKES